MPSLFLGLGLGWRQNLGSALAYLSDYLLALGFDKSKYRQGDRYFTDPMAAVGPELVTNGTFDTDTSGWLVTPSAALTADNGQGHQEISAATNGSYQVLSGLIIGSTYKVDADTRIGTNATNTDIRVTDGGGTSNIALNLRSTSSSMGSISGTFVATQTSHRVYIITGASVYPAISYVDNISVREIPATYSRAGAKSEINSDGSLTAFAANVPGITDEGYHARQAFTNLLTYSQQFDNGAWSKVETTVTANAAIAPDGTNTADLMVPSTVNSYHYIAQVTGIDPSTSKATYQFFVKPAGYNFVRLFNQIIGVGIDIDLINKTASTHTEWSNASVTDAANGFYKIEATYTGTRTQADIDIQPMPSALASTQFAGDGVSGIYIWQAQLVQGTVPGPIIATTSAAATVGEDNLAFNINEDGSALVDQDMLIFATGTPGEITGTQTLASLYVSANERIRLQLVSGVLTAIVTVGGVDVYSQTVAGALTAGTKFTAALRRSGSNWRVSKYVGSTLNSGTQASGTFPTGMTKSYVGNVAGGGAPFRGIVAGAPFVKLATFATDAEVIAAIEETL